MSAKIITCFNQKGGSAKTMTAMQLGGAIGLRGLKTLVVDMDKQGTAYVWSTKAPRDKPFPAKVEPMYLLQEGLIEQIEKVADDYDVIIIDCPPAIDSRIPWIAMTISDVALIPTFLTMDNYWAARPAKEMAMRVKEHNKNLQVYYVLSNFRRGVVASQVVKKLKQEADEVPILGKGLSQRNAYSDCQVFGTTVHMLPKAGKAVDEVEEMTTSLLAKLHITAPIKPVEVPVLHTEVA